MLILLSANKLDILDNIPIREKSSTPCILNAFHPWSHSIALSGTEFVLHTNNNSSSAF